MKVLRNLLLTVLACSALAGCGESATEPAASAAAMLSNGVLVGSGHDEGAVITSEGTTASDTTAQRGGHGFGSGN